MIRVLVVTPVRLFSDLIQVACRDQQDVQVIGCVTDKTQAETFRNKCDVMLVSHDVENALSLVQTFGRHASSPAVLVMGLPNVEPLIMRYLEGGAAGCIREQDSSADLVNAIRLAAARQIALHAELFPFVLKRVSALASAQRASPTQTSPNDKSLTRREREILQLLAQGCGNREIAQNLVIELGTAKNHVHNILDKLNVKSRRDAALYFALGLA